MAAGDVVRGVVLASDRGGAVVQIGDYRARVGCPEIAWTQPRERGRGRCPAAPSRPSRSVVLRGRRQEGSQGPARAGAQGRGRPCWPSTCKTRRRARPWWAATTSSAASSTARPRRCGRSARPSSPSSTPPPSRTRAGPRPPSSSTPPSRSRTRGTRPSGPRTTTTAPSGGPSRCGAPWSRAGTSRPIKTLQADGHRDRHRVRAQARPHRASCRPTFPSPSARARPRLIEMVAAFATFAEPGAAHEADAHHAHHRPRRQHHRGGRGRRPRTRSAPTPPTS